MWGGLLLEWRYGGGKGDEPSEKPLAVVQGQGFPTALVPVCLLFSSFLFSLSPSFHLPLSSSSMFLWAPKVADLHIHTTPLCFIFLLGLLGKGSFRTVIPMMLSVTATYEVAYPHVFPPPLQPLINF